jgi:HPt (histidine-containing phosphotransfer) domain-containing protein
MPRALILCDDPLLRRPLLRALRGLMIEPVPWEAVAPAGEESLRGILVALLDLRHPHYLSASTAALRSRPPLPRVFLCGDLAPPALHEADAVLAGAFSFTDLQAILQPILLNPPIQLPPRVFDPARLLDCTRGDADETTAMVELFLRSAEGQLAAAEAALHQGRSDAAREACHRLCGAAATAGAEELAGLCRETMNALEAGERGVSVAPLAAALRRFREAYGPWFRQVFSPPGDDPEKIQSAPPCPETDTSS